jgi:phosphopantothenoylcysteine decarboxylase/phosphopantothenate--cysteine ligase
MAHARGTYLANLDADDIAHPDRLARQVAFLEANPDILTGVVERRGPAQRPVIVGFAAQTGDLESEGRAKLAAKGVDMLVANDVSAPGIGFDAAENAVLILHRDGSVREVPRASKGLVAEVILDELVKILGPVDAAR